MQLARLVFTVHFAWQIKQVVDEPPMSCHIDDYTSQYQRTDSRPNSPIGYQVNGNFSGSVILY